MLQSIPMIVSGLSGGAIAGIVIGVFAVIGLVAGAVYVLVLRHSQQSQPSMDREGIMNDIYGIPDVPNAVAGGVDSGPVYDNGMDHGPDGDKNFNDPVYNDINSSGA